MRGKWAFAIALSGCIDYGISKPDGVSSDGDTASGSDGPLSDSPSPDGNDSGAANDSAAPEDPDPDPTPEPPLDTGTPDSADPPDDTGGPPFDTAPPFIDTGPPPILTCDDMETEDTVEVNEDCLSEPVTGTIDTVTEWSMDSFMDYWEYDNILVVPVVGNMTDDNADGVIGFGDIPDIVFVTDDGGREESTQGVLRMVSGDGADVHLTVRNTDTEDGQILIHRYSGVSIGDVDGDGLPDIATVIEHVPPPDEDPSDPSDPPEHPVGPPPPPGWSSMGPVVASSGPTAFPDCYPALYSATGDVLWVAFEAKIECGSHAPVLADLEGDGEVEVIVSRFILSGVDGRLLAEGSGGLGMTGSFVEMGTIPVVVDLDLDGQQEILSGNTVYAADGSTRCTVDATDGYTAAADLDGDGEGEIVLVSDGMITIAEADCSTTATWAIEGEGTGGPPTIADFDADGHPEIGVASASAYAVYEPDRTGYTPATIAEPSWSHAVTDESSHSTGSTVFDFEGDGRPEVIYADEETLWILDGLTGEVRLADAYHSSRTLHEYPVVADVDADGYPEIVVPNGGGHSFGANTGLYVLGSPTTAGWLGGRQVWNQHAYNIVNINDDLSIPATPDPNWPLHNNFRSGDVNPVAAEYAPDAIPVADVCTIECEAGTVELIFRIGNSGMATLREDLNATVWSISEMGSWSAVEVIMISPPIHPGETSEEIRRVYPVDEVGAGGLVLTVDNREGVPAVRECDEENNVLLLPEATCE